MFTNCSFYGCHPYHLRCTPLQFARLSTKVGLFLKREMIFVVVQVIFNGGPLSKNVIRDDRVRGDKTWKRDYKRFWKKMKKTFQIRTRLLSKDRRPSNLSEVRPVVDHHDGHRPINHRRSIVLFVISSFHSKRVYKMCLLVLKNAYSIGNQLWKCTHFGMNQGIDDHRLTMFSDRVCSSSHQ